MNVSNEAGCGVVIRDCSSRFGSAIALFDVPVDSSSQSSNSDAYSMGIIDISNNNASYGATIYWQYSSEPMSSYKEPLELSRYNIVFDSDNIAPYGVEYGTQQYSIEITQQYTVKNYDTILSPYINATYKDYYDQRVWSDDYSTLTFSTSNTSGCFGTPGAGLTSQEGGNSYKSSRGSIDANQLEALCYPTGKMAVSVSASGIYPDTVSNFSTSDLFYPSISSVFVFRQCKDGEVIKSSGCELCPNGSYSLNFVDDTTVCEDCPDDTETCYGDVLFVKEGYWRRMPDTSYIFECSNSHACLGGSTTGDESCATGYMGPMCGVCESGYALGSDTSNECTKCTSDAYFTIGLIILVIIVLLIPVFLYYNSIVQYVSRTFSGADNETYSKIYYWLIEDRRTLVPFIAKILLSTLQIVCQLGYVVKKQFPSALSGTTNVLSFVNLSVGFVVPLACVFSNYNFISQLYLVTIFPLVLLLIIVVFYVGEKIHLVRNAERYNDARSYNDETSRIENKYLVYGFYLSYIILPTVCTTIFQIFRCTDIDPDNEDSLNDLYLSVDLSVSCNSQEYKTAVIYAVFMVFVYPVGIPLAYYILLNKHKDDISLEAELLNENKESTDEKDGSINHISSQNQLRMQMLHGIRFLYGSYLPEYWYFEIIETYRRLSLTAFLSVISPGSPLQVCIGLLLSIIFEKLYNYMKPYFNGDIQNVASCGHIVILVAMVCATAVVSDANYIYEYIVSVLVVLGIISFIVLVCRMLYFDYEESQVRNLHQLRHGSLSENPIHKKTNTNHSNRNIDNEAGIELKKYTTHKSDTSK